MCLQVNYRVLIKYVMVIDKGSMKHKSDTTQICGGDMEVFPENVTPPLTFLKFPLN